MNGFATQFYGFIARLALGMGLVLSSVLCAWPTGPVTIHVKHRYTLPASPESVLTATGTLTLDPERPSSATLRYDWDKETRNEVLSLERMLVEERDQLSDRDVAQIETFLAKFRRSSAKDYQEEISLKHFDKLRKIYDGSSQWEFTANKEGGEVNFPGRPDKQAPLHVLADPSSNEYTPLVPFLEAEYVPAEGEARPALREQTFHRSLEDIQLRHVPQVGGPITFYPSPQKNVALPVFYLGKDLWGRHVIVSYEEWRDFKLGLLKTLPLYSVDKRTLGAPMEIPFSGADSSQLLRPWMTGEIARESTSIADKYLLETLERDFRSARFSIKGSICDKVNQSNN